MATLTHLLSPYEIREDDESLGIYVSGPLARRAGAIGIFVFGIVTWVIYAGVMAEMQPAYPRLSSTLRAAYPWVPVGFMAVCIFTATLCLREPRPKPHHAELWLQKKTGLIRHSGYTVVRPNINETAAMQIRVFPRARDGSYPYHIVFHPHENNAGTPQSFVFRLSHLSNVYAGSHVIYYRAIEAWCERAGLRFDGVERRDAPD